MREAALKFFRLEVKKDSGEHTAEKSPRRSFKGSCTVFQCRFLHYTFYLNQERKPLLMPCALWPDCRTGDLSVPIRDIKNI